MSRRPRFPLTDLPLHVVQRGNNRQPCFFSEVDYRIYLRALHEASLHYGVRIHAYVLMTNHVHLLATPGVNGALSKVMQSVGARYVWHVNKTRERTGTLWEGRYKACIVACDAHLLAACRYIDVNPVRAGMVHAPGEYPWSSYACLSGTRDDRLVTPHPALRQLGISDGAAYVQWCAQAPHDGDIERLREATQRELAFGSDTFKAELEARTMRQAREQSRGRPRRAASPA